MVPSVARILTAFDEVAAASYNSSMSQSKSQDPLASSQLRQHFGDIALHELVTATREFPTTARLDLQIVLISCLISCHQAKLRLCKQMFRIEGCYLGLAAFLGGVFRL
jgi:hypothetical protein